MSSKACHSWPGSLTHMCNPQQPLSPTMCNPKQSSSYRALHLDLISNSSFATLPPLCFFICLSEVAMHCNWLYCLSHLCPPRLAWQLYLHVSRSSPHTGLRQGGHSCMQGTSEQACMHAWCIALHEMARSACMHGTWPTHPPPRWAAAATHAGARCTPGNWAADTMA